MNLSFGRLSPRPAPAPNKPAVTTAAGFNPYVDNGGTLVALKVEGAVLLASDTRLVEHHTIHSRDQPKIFQLTDSTMLGATGCWTDSLNIYNMMRIHVRQYEFKHNRTIDCKAAANYLSNLIYARRVILPYRSANIIAGLTEEKESYICSFDGLGHKIYEPYAVGGSAGHLILPVLDSQLTFRLENGLRKCIGNFSKEDAKHLIKDCFIIAADRNLYTGDGAVIKTLSSEGVDIYQFALRGD